MISTRFVNVLYRNTLKGQSVYRSARRYEVAINCLFFFSLVVCAITAAIAYLDNTNQIDPMVPNIALFAAVLISLWWLSRVGQHTITAFALLLCSGFAMTNVLLTRHFGLPSLEIGIAFCMAIIGMLLEVRLTRAELAAEHDLLEQRVIERTQLLEETQMRRTLELQRFAEFGRFSSQLLHDVSVPLTAASLHLEHADQRSSTAIRQARRSLQQLEKYIANARKQLQQESPIDTFSVQQEIKQLLAILRPLAYKNGVRICLEQSERATVHGDPVRFAQIMANLITNAIDAYGPYNPLAKQRIVRIRCTGHGRFVKITVHDSGKGISAQQLPQIFEPFYTTKQDAGRGLGIGLSIVKSSVRQCFNGTICANSLPGSGTTFTLLLRVEPPIGQHMSTTTDTSGAVVASFA